jgi:LPXTG-site transpeptidase (sortase) family protein
MILVGSLLLVFVGTQYAHSWIAQRRLARAWAEQQHAHTEAVSDGLTRLSIPSINLNAIVVEGTKHRDLLLGPGHLQNTAVPGETGNSVITAHRDTFFRHIYELNKGDLVNVERNGELFRYQVIGRRIVRPDDLSVTEPSSEPRLTLITCYPTYYIGPAPKRLVVFTRMLDSPRSIAQDQIGPTNAAISK